MLCFLLLLASAGSALEWTDARELTLEGQAWTGVLHPFDRLPGRAREAVREPVWKLSQDSAGMAIRFVTDAARIAVRWVLRKESLTMPHMAATGASGVDLYVRLPGGWRWAANGRPTAVSNEQVLVEDWPGGTREYLFYLPLYNGVESVQFGVPPPAALRPARPRPERPILFYGSSILQGGCASRPGMAYPSIVGRRLDWPVINLGFSGNAKSEPEIAALLAESDPAVFVYDSLPNLTASEAHGRVEPFLRALRKSHARTPIVLVENVLYTSLPFSESRRKLVEEKNAVLKSVYEKLRREGDRNVHYVPAAPLYGTDGEATVDGVHATDVGFMRMAEVIAGALRPLLPRKSAAR